MAAVLGGCTSESCEGDDGADGSSCWQEEQDGKTVTCCPSQTTYGEKDCHDYTGPAGPPGPTGPTGPAGSGCTLENSTTSCVDLVCGSSRKTLCSGDDGLDGANGLDGSDCSTYQDGECSMVHCEDGSYSRICPPGTPNPGCQPVQEYGERCGDGVDNDCDGMTDCTDPDCSSAPNCTGTPSSPTPLGSRFVCTIQVSSSAVGQHTTQAWLQQQAADANTCIANTSCLASVLAGTHSVIGSSYYHEETGSYQVGCWEENFALSYPGYDGVWVTVDLSQYVGGRVQLRSDGDLLVAVKTLGHAGFKSFWQSGYVDFDGSADQGPMDSVIMAANKFETWWDGQSLMSGSLPSSSSTDQNALVIDETERGIAQAMRMGNLIPSASHEAAGFIQIRAALIKPPPAQQ